jgi:hypothetical protein
MTTLTPEARRLGRRDRHISYRLSQKYDAEVLKSDLVGVT